VDVVGVEDTIDCNFGNAKSEVTTSSENVCEVAGDEVDDEAEEDIIVDSITAPS